jgi:hypothetical protein
LELKHALEKIFKATSALVIDNSHTLRHYYFTNNYCMLFWKNVLQRAGVMFPQRPVDAPPIFTPPATHQAYGSPRYPSGSLNERITSEAGTLR